MTGISNCVMVAITEISGNIDHSLPLKEKLTEAMKQSRNHWLVIDETERFNSAVLSKANDTDKEIINNDLKIIKYISALLSGIPIDCEATVNDISESKLGLQNLWADIKKS